jgi:hypothetical protein
VTPPPRPRRGVDVEELRAMASSMVDAGLASDEATAMIVLSADVARAPEKP